MTATLITQTVSRRKPGEPGPIGRFLKVAVRVLEIVGVIAAFAIMLHVFLNVLFRNFFNWPIPATLEVVANWYLPTMAMVGFVVAKARRQHIYATVIYDLLGPKNRLALSFLGNVMSAITLAVLAYYSFFEALHALEVKMTIGVQGIIIWPTLFLIPFGFGTLAVMFAVDAVNEIRFRRPAGIGGDEELLERARAVAEESNAGQGIEGVADMNADGAVDVSDVIQDAKAQAKAAEEEHVPYDDAPKDKPGLRGWMPTVIFILLTVACLLCMFFLPQREAKAGAAVVLMLVFIFMRLPVAMALCMPGLLGVLVVVGPRAVDSVAVSVPYTSVSNWSLSALPMFLLMGLLLWASGLTTKLYNVARYWLAFLPGGLAVSTNVAGTSFAAISGSTIGTTFALGRVGIPEMLRAGYDKRLALGSIMIAGLPGQLIPPSTFLIIVAGLLEVAVGPQLIAGIIPGLAVSALFTVALVIFALVKPEWAGRGKRGNKINVNEGITWGDRWKSLLWTLPLIAIIIVLFGGMFSGVLTAIEAGSAGAISAIIVVIAMQWKNKPFDEIMRGASAAVANVGAIFFLIIGALTLGQLLSISGLGRLFTDQIVGLNLDRTVFLLLVMVLYLVLGTFMESLPILLLTMPIILPILNSMDVPLIWFGVFAVFMGELAILTPPVGILAFILHALAQDKSVNLGQKITLNDVFTALWIMFPIAVLFGVLLIFFPEMATWLPSLSSSRG